MAGEDQERFEDYLELEQYIENLQAGRPARLPASITPEQARVYRMAALFRSATAGAIEPRPEFISELSNHLHTEAREQTQIAPGLFTRGQNGQQPTGDEPTIRLSDLNQGRSGQAPARGITPQPPDLTRPDRPTTELRQKPPAPKRRSVSRRSLLTGSAVAAASLATGAATGALITQSQQPPAQPPAEKWPPLVNNIPVTWHRATPVTNLKGNAVKFVTEGVIGYVIHDEEQDEVIAFSAACTHMGCIVQWNGDQRRFDCPCHDGRFTVTGKPDASGALQYLRALPRLTVRVEDDQVYVAVPKTT